MFQMNLIRFVKIFSYVFLYKSLQGLAQVNRTWLSLIVGYGYLRIELPGRCIRRKPTITASDSSYIRRMSCFSPNIAKQEGRIPNSNDTRSVALSVGPDVVNESRSFPPHWKGKRSPRSHNRHAYI